MPSFFNINLPLPRKSKFNLSHDHASSHCIGTLDPVLCEYLPTNTDVDISIQNVVRTSPAICPVFGTLRQDYHIFFVPMRLFVPSMRLNTLEDETSSTFVDTPLPAWPLYGESLVDTPGTAPSTPIFKVNATSLMGRLGYGVEGGPGLSWTTVDTTSRSIQPIPIWSYYSIFYNYYLNRQCLLYWGYDGNSTPPWNASAVTTPVFNTARSVDNLRRSLLAASNGAVPDDTSLNYALFYKGAYRLSTYFRGGLVVRSRPSDLFTTFVSNESVTAARAFSKITTASDGSITFDQIRTSSAITGFVERLIAAGGRYLDWLTVTSGVKSSHKCDIPEYIGSTSGSIVFDMITNVSGQDFGDLGGRGQGGVSGRRHRFTNTEPGFLMVIYSIVPNVLYSYSSRPWCYGTELSDFYNTSLDRLTWQDLQHRWVDASNVSFANPLNHGWSQTTGSIGKQPAWFEETSIPGRTSGLLATTLRYWTFSLGATPESTSYQPYNFPYCRPDDFQYIFEAPQQDNFFVYHQFRFFARKQKSKNALPRVL